MMERARKKFIPVCPPTIREVVESFEEGRNGSLYQEMYVGHVYHDFQSRASPGERKRRYALLFCNKPVLDDVYRTCTFFSMDGTFRTTPMVSTDLSDRAAQILIITADYHGKVAVVFVVVMQCRKRALYRKVYKALRSKEPRFEPIMMMSDFERAMRRSFLEIYPDCRLYGCR